MATLTNTKIKDTYDGLLKTTDNDVIGASEKVITDGLGNASVLSIGTGSASFSDNVSITGSLTASNAVTAGTVSVGDAIVHTGDTDTKIEFLSNQIKTTLGGTLEINSTVSGTIFYKDIEVNGLTIGKGANDVSTNTALGYQTLENATGAGNTAVGYASLLPNTTGVNNSSLGLNSLRNNTTGNYNTAIGSNALQVNVDGDRNAALGYGAGYNKTGGNDNVYIGYQAIGGAVDSSNEIVIGKGATGNGSNTATYGNSSITNHHFTSGQVNVAGNLAVDTNTLYVDATNNRVGIGTSSPGAKLEVNGDGSIFRLDGTANTSRGMLLRNVGTATAEIKTDGNLDFNIEDAGRTMRFLNGNTERMRIDSAGNVGIGTSSPQQLLSIQNTASNAYLHCVAGTSNLGGVWVGDSDANYVGGFLYDNGINTSLFYTNGSERMRIDSSGNVRLSGTAPSAEDTISKIDFYNNSSSINLAGIEGKRTAGGTNYGSLIFSTTNSGTSSEKMRIDSSGNVGIGVVPSSTTGTNSLDVSGAIIARGLISDHQTSAGVLDLNGDMFSLRAYGATAGSGYLVFKTGGGGGSTDSERMRITSGGDVLIDATSASLSNGTTLYEGGGIATTRSDATVVSINRQTTFGTAVQFYQNNDAVGSISVTSTTTSYNTSSDYRLKENVVEMTGALDRVDSLKPSRFNFIGDEATVDGFLAHEVADIVPEAVTGEKDAVDEEGNPIYQGIDQSKIVPLLVGAIQELRAEIESLKNA